MWYYKKTPITINHLMFYKLGMVTFYWPNFIWDLAKLGKCKGKLLGVCLKKDTYKA